MKTHYQYRRATPPEQTRFTSYTRGPGALLRRWRGTDVAWQHDAWRWYHRIPELRSAVNYKAQAASRIQLYVGTPDPDGSGQPKPVTDPDLQRPLKQLYGGTENHHEMLRRWTQQLLVAGEAFVVAADINDDTPQTDPEPADAVVRTPNTTGTRRVWQVISSQDMRQASGYQWEIEFATPHGTVTKTYDARPTTSNDNDMLLLRGWINDAQHYNNPDSPVKSMLDILSALDGVNGHIKATSESRLAGVGMLGIHDDLTINPMSTNTDASEDPELASLVDAMTSPIKDRSVASAVVPIPLRFGGERKIDELIKWITRPGTEYDKNLLSIRNALLLSIASGIDVPAEVVTGVNDANHWNALYEGQDAVRIGLAWILNEICSTLTNGFLRPALKDSGRLDADSYVMGWDASRLTMDPDRSEVALQLAAQGTQRGTPYLSDEAVRKACGFSEDDAPNRNTPVPKQQSSTSVEEPGSTSGFPRTGNVGVAPGNRGRL